MLWCGCVVQYIPPWLPLLLVWRFVLLGLGLGLGWLCHVYIHMYNRLLLWLLFDLCELYLYSPLNQCLYRIHTNYLREREVQYLRFWLLLLFWVVVVVVVVYLHHLFLFLLLRLHFGGFI